MKPNFLRPSDETLDPTSRLPEAPAFPLCRLSKNPRRPPGRFPMPHPWSLQRYLCVKTSGSSVRTTFSSSCPGPGSSTGPRLRSALALARLSPPV